MNGVRNCLASLYSTEKPSDEAAGLLFGSSSSIVLTLGSSTTSSSHSFSLTVYNQHHLNNEHKVQLDFIKQTHQIKALKLP